MLEFTDAAILDINYLKSSSKTGEIETIYIGGGTPTCLTAECLQRLLDALSPFIKGATEITCEANPDSATPQKLKILNDAGVNRLSMGVQSFSDDNLKLLGRLHDSKGAIRAYQTAREIGFNNIRH